MSNLDLLKARLNAAGGTADIRIQKEKLRSLQGALKYSYQSESIILNGKSERALINNNKLKMDYDDKIISIPHSSQIRVGDVFFWERTGSDWIVYLQHLSEDAYFRGYVRKAQHTIKWKDAFGKVCEVKAAVRGPVETKVRSQMKKGISFDEPNYTLSLIVPGNEDTQELVRYTKIMVANKPWEIVAQDALSEPGVIELQMVEDYFNREEDTKEVAGGQKKTEVVVVSCLDDIDTAKVNQPIDLWTDAMVDGIISKDLVENARYEIVEGFANIKNKQLTITNDTKVKIALVIEKADFRKEFVIQGAYELEQSTIDVDIVGSERVKSYGSTTYKIVKYLNGTKVLGEGSWTVNGDSSLYKIADSSSDEITITWSPGKTGNIELVYTDPDKIVSRKIVIESLL